MSLDNDDLRAHIEREVSSSTLILDSELSDAQGRALSYYFGLPLGDEAEGRSQLVSWDVFEVVETATPELLEPFFAEEKLADLEPVTPSDMQAATEATEYLNHKLLKCNPAFDIFQAWVKDALITRLGVVRVWFDKTPIKQRRTYRNLDINQASMLLSEKGIEIVEKEETPTGAFDPMTMQPVMTYTLTVMHDRGPRGLRYENVAPENFIISKASTVDEATTIGELRCYRASDLVDMGFKKELVEELSDYDVYAGQNSALKTLRDGSSATYRKVSDEDSNREITLFFGFTKYDDDGDGVAEWRRVLMGGNGEPLENDEVDDHEYCLWTPIKVPHRIHGLSYADPVLPIQELNTSLQRQYIDSLFLSNNPRTFAAEGVNMPDLLDNRIGGVVRMRTPGLAGPLQTSLVANESLQGLEWGKTMRENRIGVLRNGTGLDKDSLNPRTAKEISVVESTQQRRMKVTLRAFAEGGVKTLVRKALRLVIDHQKDPDSVYIGKQFKSFNPAHWNPEMSVTISVGLGTGDKSETLQALQMFGQFMQMAGAQKLPMVQLPNIYEFGKQLAKAAKLKHDVLLTDPQKAPPPPPQQPPPQVMVEQMKQQAEQQKFQAQTQADAMEADKQRAHEIALQGQKLQADNQQKLFELAAGMIAAQQQAHVSNLVNGTYLDQAGQAPGVTVPQMQATMAQIDAMSRGMQ